ncbi:hypothetical protein DFA_05645 [Cavenderia fasciculata]|uniref:Acyltransferase 3 domain-containing protein n=1 Tax=Cavenderia fasciculata TaxID=261658 RepID=F4PLV8_CACFS|nr:uncharacterized protein DFA_05645 [Cavenderia fasciculata]EGG23512.1 hypothetical protein DFA_05645 [Cavenderia fasciculata]|eukprot:XP_004361363.1 hypothetical protein DFA_05645 [Cavenderia fasciculata]
MKQTQVVVLLLFIVCFVSVSFTQNNHLLNNQIKYLNNKNHPSDLYNNIQAQDVNIFQRSLESKSIIGLTASSNISTQCQSDMTSILGLSYPNATALLSFTGKSMWDFGNYQECLELPMNVSTYCLYQNEYMGLTYFIGVCYPASCSEEDVANLVPSYSLSVQQGVAVVHCYTQDDRTVREYTTGSYVMIVLSCIIAATCLIASLLDHYIHIRQAETKKTVLNSINYDDDNNNNPYQSLLNNERSINNMFDRPPMAMKALLCFSLKKNYNSFVGGSSTKKYFDALDGVRTFSTMWVILGHTILFNASIGYDNAGYLVDTIKQGFAFQAIPSGEYAVDIFFTLSGFLVCYSLINQLNKYRQAGKETMGTYGSPGLWAMYMIHRVVRLSPIYFFLIFFFWHVGPLLGYGPAYYLYNSVVNPMCQQRWWTNLLYINNLTSTMSGECFSWAWYLANDMQFYLFAPFIVIAYRKSKVLAWSIIFILLAFTLIFTTWVSIDNNLEPLFLFTNGFLESGSFITDVYQKPWNRYGPYLVGMGVAFLYLEPKTATLYEKKWFRYSIYIVSFITTFFLSYLPYFYFLNPWSNVGNGFYGGFSRTSFTMAFSGFILATFYGHGGFLKWILEIPIWKSFSKLTYSIYLVHPIVIMVRVFSSTLVFHYSWTEYTYSFIGNLVVAIASAFTIHLTIEKPMVNLFTLFVPHK